MIARSLARAGAQWAISDEDVLGRSLGLGWERDGQGIPVHADALYRTYRYQEGPALVFRDHTISDLIGFTYSSWGPLSASFSRWRRTVIEGPPCALSAAYDGGAASASDVSARRAGAMSSAGS